MKHTKLTDSLQAQAALYALGALAPDETRSYEAHLEDGCRLCRAEADSLRAASGNLALVAFATAPRREVRSRVLAAAREAQAASPRSSFRFVMNREGDWIEIQPGVFRKDLAATPGASSTSYLIRLQPGARVSSHTHDALEHCYVLEGDLHIAGRHIHAGDFHVADPGSTHAASLSERGCVLLIVEGRVQ